MAARISFNRKLKQKLVRLRGTKPSIHNAQQLITSSGIPTLDGILGGGFAVGSVTLVEEDVFGNYANLLLKYFLAEGVVSGHGIFLAGDQKQINSTMKTLPKPITTENKNPNANNENLQIAWRYKDLPNLENTMAVNATVRDFDVSESMSQDLIDRCKPMLFTLGHVEEPPLELGLECQNGSRVYGNLLQKLRDHIKTCNSWAESSKIEMPTVLRAGIHSLGSPYWPDNSKLSQLIRFIYRLRAIARETYTVILITLPTHLLEDSHSILRLHRACDTVLRLETFQSSLEPTNPLYKDYQGLFRVAKYPRINSMSGLPHANTINFAFQLRRKKFLIQTLHLPPDISETGSSRVDAKSFRSPAASCSRSKLLDF